MIVVSDTSPIRALMHIGLFAWVGQKYGEVVIPPFVAAELAVASSGVESVSARDLPGVRVVQPVDRKRVQTLRLTLGPGEAEAIALAMELNADLLLVDDLRARRAAERLGLNPLGALGLLVRAKEAGQVEAVAPLLDRLASDLDFRMSPDLRSRILREAEEQP